MIYKNILDLIGNTPVVKLSNLVDDNMAEVYVKLEKFNLGGSIKDRAALFMIEEAEKNGVLKNGSIILEPTSGNTGIALAMIGKLKGYEVHIVMPDSMSKERRDLITSYGAKLILSDGKDGMSGAIKKAYELAQNDKRYFIPQQFENHANTKAHYETTALEIINDFDALDAFVAGVGTGGTISGNAKRLKQKFSDIKIIAVEPQSSAVLSGQKAGAHKIQGIGTGFIPDICDVSLIDEIIQVSNENAFKTCKDLANKEGLFLGISSGANVYAAIHIAQKLGKGKKVLTIAPDGGEKYLSTGVFDA